VKSGKSHVTLDSVHVGLELPDRDVRAHQIRVPFAANFAIRIHYLNVYFDRFKVVLRLFRNLFTPIFLGYLAFNFVFKEWYFRCTPEGCDELLPIRQGKQTKVILMFQICSKSHVLPIGKLFAPLGGVKSHYILHFVDINWLQIKEVEVVDRARSLNLTLFVEIIG